MAARICGVRNIVFGVQDPRPLADFPPGRIRMRMRAESFAVAFVKTTGGIRQFSIEEKDGFWVPCFELAANHTRDSK